MGSSHGSDSARGTRRARPCGFAAALGRRSRVAHNSTGPTLSKHCLMKQKEELRLGRRTSQATSARVVRQCSTVWGTFADVAIPLPIHIAGHIITAEP